MRTNKEMKDIYNELLSVKDVLNVLATEELSSTVVINDLNRLVPTLNVIKDRFDKVKDVWAKDKWIDRINEVLIGRVSETSEESSVEGTESEVETITPENSVQGLFNRAQDANLARFAATGLRVTVVEPTEKAFNEVADALTSVLRSNETLVSYASNPNNGRTKARVAKVVHSVGAGVLALALGAFAFVSRYNYAELNEQYGKLQADYVNVEEQLNDALQNMNGVDQDVYNNLLSAYNAIMALIPEGVDVDEYISGLQNNSDMYNVLMALIPEGENANEYIQNLQAEKENYEKIMQLLPKDVEPEAYLQALQANKAAYDAIMEVIPEGQDAVAYINELIANNGLLAGDKAAYDAIMAVIPEENKNDAVAYIQAIVANNGDLEDIKAAYDAIMAEIPEGQDAIEYIKWLASTNGDVVSLQAAYDAIMAVIPEENKNDVVGYINGLVESNGALAGDKAAYDAIMAVIPEENKNDVVAYIQAIVASNGDLENVKDAYEAIMAEVPEEYKKDAVAYIQAIVASKGDLENIKAAYDVIMAVVPEENKNDVVGYINGLVESNGALAGDKAAYDAIMAVIPEGKDAVTYINELVTNNGVLAGDKAAYDAIMAVIPEENKNDVVGYINSLKDVELKFEVIKQLIPENIDAAEYIKGLKEDSSKYADLFVYVPEGKEPADYIQSLLAYVEELEGENANKDAELSSKQEEIDRLEAKYEEIVGEIASVYASTVGGSEADPRSQFNAIVDYYINSYCSSSEIKDCLVRIVSEIKGLSYSDVNSMSPAQLISLAEQIVGAPSAPSTNPENGTIRGEEIIENESQKGEDAISPDLPPVRE